jgi:hypothetical protein
MRLGSLPCKTLNIFFVFISRVWKISYDSFSAHSKIIRHQIQYLVSGFFTCLKVKYEAIDTTQVFFNLAEIHSRSWRLNDITEKSFTSEAQVNSFVLK